MCEIEILLFNEPSLIDLSGDRRNNRHLRHLIGGVQMYADDQNLKVCADDQYCARKHKFDNSYLIRNRTG